MAGAALCRSRTDPAKVVGTKEELEIRDGLIRRFSSMAVNRVLPVALFDENSMESASHAVAQL